MEWKTFEKKNHFNRINENECDRWEVEYSHFNILIAFYYILLLFKNGPGIPKANKTSYSIESNRIFRHDFFFSFFPKYIYISSNLYVYIYICVLCLCLISTKWFAIECLIVFFFILHLLNMYGFRSFNCFFAIIFSVVYFYHLFIYLMFYIH